MRGAYASKGGKSFMLLSSTYERKGVRKSRIVLDLTPGNHFIGGGRLVSNRTSNCASSSAGLLWSRCGR